MQLTPKQIRTSCRTHVLLAEGVRGGAGDDLLGAVCQRLASLPEIRWTAVHAARERLRTDGPPSAQVLADMLMYVLRLTCLR